MTDLITPALAAACLVAYPPFLTTPNNKSIFIFKVIPTAIGAALAFQTYGRFMGWPV